jgi:hypothetical protein
MTLAQLISTTNSLLTRVGSNRVSGSDILTAVLNIINYFATQIADIIPEWTNALTFQTDGTDAGKYCVYADTNGKKRIWETLVDDNINHLPPSNPSTTSNAFWQEVSASQSAAIPEWAAGVFGPGLVIVFHNHSTDGRGLYALIEPVRPYASSNIETEITAGDWERLGGAGDPSEYIDTANTLNTSGKTIPGRDAVKSYIEGVLRPTSAGVLAGTELTFDQVHKKYTKAISSDQTLSLAASGNIADSYITIKTTGNAVNELAFPSDWLILGDEFSKDHVQEITFRYTGEHVIGVITTLEEIPDVIAPTIIKKIITYNPDNVLQLTFDEAVNISTAGWSIATDGASLSISSVLSGNGTTTPKFQLSRSILGTETITISYDTGTGNTQDAAGNELASISNSPITNLVPLLFDDFADGVISTSNWDVTDPADGVAIAETSGQLRFTATPASPVASSNTNNVVSDNSFALGSKNVFRCTVGRNTESAGQLGAFKVYNASDAFATARQVQIGKSATNTLHLRIYNGSTFIYDFTSSVPWSTGEGVAVKIVIESTDDIKFYHWDGASWVQIGTTQNYNLGGPVKVAMQANSVNTDTGTPYVTFDTVFVTKADYSTVIPD